MKDIKLVAFDMDGTVLNTLRDLTDSINHVLLAHGFPSRTPDEVRQFVGNGARKLVERAVMEESGSSESSSLIDTLLAEFREYYHEHSAIHTSPYPGIPELLTRLREAGIATAVVSNKPDAATRLLAEKFFPGLFDIAIGEREGLTRKPAPDMLEYVMRKIGVTAAETLYVGDSDVDIETARAAGVSCRSVTWGFRDEEFLIEHGATRLIRDPSELTEM